MQAMFRPKKMINDEESVVYSYRIGISFCIGWSRRHVLKWVDFAG